MKPKSGVGEILQQIRFCGELRSSEVYQSQNRCEMKPKGLPRISERVIRRFLSLFHPLVAALSLDQPQPPHRILIHSLSASERVFEPP